MSFNKIIIVGNLGRDPELRYTPQGTAVCNFTLAVNEKKRDADGERRDRTTWFTVTLWRQQAELAAKHLGKGSLVYVEGRLHVEEWQDRDGKGRYTLAVTGSEMHFLSSNSDRSNADDYSGGEVETAPIMRERIAAHSDDDSQIPF